VVVLGIILEYFWLLLIIEVPYKIVQTKIFSPGLALDEPFLLSTHTLGGSGGGTYIFSVRVTSNLRALRNRSYTARLAIVKRRERER
jgi:hypothetical protein